VPDTALPWEEDIGRTDLPSGTASAPPFRALAGAGGGVAEPVGLLAAGDRIDDFEVRDILGRGSFAIVYLAHQVSLDRQVALKVTADRGHEARTLAGLEHDHIVRVFSETIDRARGLRLLCMQLVPGTTLERVIRRLSGSDARSWSGRAILEAIDALSSQPAAFDPAALRDREVLAGSDDVGAVCWIGARLAEALAHAHARGVLHRDIKPANILLTRYGRPLLADFNMARDLWARDRDGLGGTLAYMAPEHLDAFHPNAGVAAEAVDERSDVYSLGVVLFELLTGRLPFLATPGAEGLAGMAAERHRGVSLQGLDKVPESLRRVLSRCLAPQPEQRYQTAAELAAALEGCRELHRVRRGLPAGGPLARAAVRHPFATMAILALLPHILGSSVNISYNSSRIVNDLTPPQRFVFGRLALAYNALAYPLCLLIVVRLVLPVMRVWRRLGEDGPGVEAAAVGEARRRVLRWPLWIIGLSCAGWLPGGLLFPLGLQVLAGPLPAGVFGHFVVSFTTAGLIALTYALFAVQFVVLRGFYPRLWGDTRDVRARAAVELAPLDRRLGLFQVAAGMIPLAGAVLMIRVAPEELNPADYQAFRVLLTALIALGMVGFGVASAVSRDLGHVLAAWAGERRSMTTSAQGRQ
jgi:serine/threonine protein kinase